jgi:hypothetical protein
LTGAPGRVDDLAPMPPNPPALHAANAVKHRLLRAIGAVQEAHELLCAAPAAPAQLAADLERAALLLAEIRVQLRAWSLDQNVKHLVRRRADRAAVRQLLDAGARRAVKSI